MCPVKEMETVQVFLTEGFDLELALTWNWSDQCSSLNEQKAELGDPGNSCHPRAGLRKGKRCISGTKELGARV